MFLECKGSSHTPPDSFGDSVSDVEVLGVEDVAISGVQGPRYGALRDERVKIIFRWVLVWSGYPREYIHGSIVDDECVIHSIPLVLLTRAAELRPDN